MSSASINSQCYRFLVLLGTMSVICSSDCSGSPVDPGPLPCLPDKQEFWGTDTKHPSHTYPIRYDITPAQCHVTRINTERDLPQCVPEHAVKDGSTWSFKNIDGATLYYEDVSPSRIVRKVSPDGKNSDTFSDWNNTISDNLALEIPLRCVNMTNAY